MIDCARAPFDTMCDMYAPAPPPTARLADFEVFKKSPYIYNNYYSYNCYEDPNVDSATVYHSMVSARDCPREDWRSRLVADWSEDDTVAWLVDTTQTMGFTEYEIPYYNFKVPGRDIRLMKKDEIHCRLLHPHVEPMLSERIADAVYDRLHCRLNEEMLRQSSVIRYPDSDYDVPVQTMLDLDSYKQNESIQSLPGFCESSDEGDFRQSESASPVLSCGSDGSKSGDEDDKKKMFKRPPGRPKGSGRKVCKRPRSVSVPEFLRDMLLDPKYCPSIIKWEDYPQGKFRFVKPDEVAKLWGKQKQNDGMTFEKFSRAMRYHYRQSVLVSVPTARLVYQFGAKGPDYRTDNPNFGKIKAEFERVDVHS